MFFLSHSFIYMLICLGSSFAWALDDFHHHIHNFSSNYNRNTTNAGDYALTARHALAMGYTVVTIGKPDETKYEQLGVMKLHNAYYAPMRFDLTQKKVSYFDYYADKNKNSLVRTDRNTWNWQAWDSEDFELLKAYGCAKSQQYKSTDTVDTLDELQQTYWTQWQNGSQSNVVANLQSRWVVDQLVQMTVASLFAGNYGALFFDDLARDNDTCINKEAGGKGAYASWKDGQKDFVKRLTDWLHGRYTHNGKHYRISGNIWSPKSTLVKNTILKWYANRSLRLDHYYYEAGDYHGVSQSTDGIDPETGLPAFTSKSGYLPANVVSLSTTYGWYGPSVGDGAAAFFDHHLEVASTAAMQGSWFGWYGQNNVDRRDSYRRLVYTNDLQLLRAIPGLDNLAGLSLADRHYDPVLMQYRSSNSFASRDIIYSRHFATGELYVVFLKVGSEVTLRPGEKVLAAYFVNEVFETTTENAKYCIAQSSSRIRLTCASKIGNGLRMILR